MVVERRRGTEGETKGIQSRRTADRKPQPLLLTASMARGKCRLYYFKFHKAGEGLQAGIHTPMAMVQQACTTLEPLMSMFR